MTKRIIFLSNDTDVLVLGLHFFNIFDKQGLCELWQRGGIGDTTRYIPVHTLANKIGCDMCSVLPALHNLTGRDTNSKIGTKYAAIKEKPSVYLKTFGTSQLYLEESVVKAEEYLVKVLSATTTFKTMDELRFYKYHHSKNITFAALPPTSCSLKGHILRAFYATHMQLNCLNNPYLDPRQYGFQDNDGLLVPTMCKLLFPDDLPQSCSCANCATCRCACRKMNVPCCEYCNCRRYDQGTLCKNPMNMPTTTSIS